MDAHQQLSNQLKEEEGFQSKPYVDPISGKWHIGYGFNIEGRVLTSKEQEVLFKRNLPLFPKLMQIVEYWKENPINESQASYLLDQSIKIATHDAKVVYGKDWDNLNENRKTVILDLLYNLGLPVYLTFKKHIAAVKNEDWKEASYQIIHSRAYTQEPKRYQELADKIVKG